MEMQVISTNQLEGMSFTKYADFIFSEVGISFSFLGHECNQLGHVYLWLEKDGEFLRVAYIGKTGKTMKLRCKKHLDGFSGASKSKAGLRHAENLKNGHKKGFSYHVFSRKSTEIEVLGEKMSIHSVEEEALIKKFSPPWNRRKS